MQNLEKILEEIPKIPRRKFLKSLAVSSVATPSIIMGCGKGKAPTSPNIKQDIETTHPYFDPEIETTIELTDPWGIATVSTDLGEIKVRVEDEETKTPLERIILRTLSTPRETIIVAENLKEEYFPSLIFSTSASSKPIGFKEEVVKMFKVGVNKIGDLAIKYLPKEITQIPEHYMGPHPLENVPFVIYRGDWSFNELKGTIDFVFNPLLTLEGDSGILSFIGEDTDLASLTLENFTPSLLMTLAEKGIDLFNKFSTKKIDKNKRYSWYGLSMLDILFFIEPSPERYVFDIKYYYPTQVGNEWIFKSEEEAIMYKSKGVKNIKGKDLLLFSSEFGEEYYGFYNDELRMYGFYEDSVGTCLFTPPITVGDSNIKLGKTYSTASKFFVEDYPEIEGITKETMTYEKSEGVLVSAGYFGGCLKVRENAEVSAYNKETGQSDHRTAIAYHWLSKNIGTVKLEIAESDILDTETYELVSANVNNMSIPKIVYSNNLQYSSTPSRLLSKILPRLIKS